MKFTISREALLHPLQMANGVVEKRQTLAVLSNLLLQLDKNTLSITGTDLEIELKATVQVETIEEGESTMPARKLSDICRALPENAKIEISIENDKALIKSSKSKFSLSTLPASDYPEIENITSTFYLSLSQKKLKHLLEQTAFCMAIQDVRYYLNGLLLEMKAGQLRTVATDGHRLALSEIDLPELAAEERQTILPRKGVYELIRLLEDSDNPCDLSVSNNHIRVNIGNVTFTSKLIDGRFPDYERVIPSHSEQKLIANRMDLYHALQRTAILSNEKFRGIRLNFLPNLLQATVNNPEQEVAEEEMSVEYTGDEIEIGFNVSYLLDALNIIKEEQVVLNLTDANSSCLLHGLGNLSSRYVVMPMRL